MKKFFPFLILILLLSSCEIKSSFKDITPTIEGVTVDSVQWEPALIQIKDEYINVYHDKKVRKVDILSPTQFIRTLLAGLLIGILIGIFIFLMLMDIR